MRLVSVSVPLLFLACLYGSTEGLLEELFSVHDSGKSEENHHIHHHHHHHEKSNPKCAPNEVWYSCLPSCDITCNNLFKTCKFSDDRCHKGCECARGFARLRPSDPCVPISQCASEWDVPVFLWKLFKIVSNLTNSQNQNPKRRSVARMNCTLTAGIPARNGVRTDSVLVPPCASEAASVNEDMFVSMENVSGIECAPKQNHLKSSVDGTKCFLIVETDARRSAIVILNRGIVHRAANTDVSVSQASHACLALVSPRECAIAARLPRRLQLLQLNPPRLIRPRKNPSCVLPMNSSPNVVARAGNNAVRAKCVRKFAKQAVSASLASSVSRVFASLITFAKTADPMQF